MTRRKWTEAEKALIKNNYAKNGAKYCAAILNRSAGSIYLMATKLGIIKEPRYTDEEINHILRYYIEKGPTALANEMNRSKTAIKDKAVLLGLNVGKQARKQIAAENRNKWTKATRTQHGIDMALKKGSLSPSWKGGVCNVSEMIRGRLYNAWSKYVMQRDNYMCVLCGERGGRLVAHHLRTFAQIRDEVLEQNPKLNVDVYEDREKISDLVIDAHKLSDGVTLCQKCHKKHHSENGVNCGDILAGSAEDNPQPSRGNVLDFVPRKVHRLTGEDAQANKPDTSAPTPKPNGCMR